MVHLLLLSLALQATAVTGCPDLDKSGLSFISGVCLAEQATQDDGYGACPAFQHAHADAPGQCFSDEDDSRIVPDSERHKLPKPAAEGEPSDDAVQAAVDSVADISEKFKLYLDPDNDLVRLEWQLVDKVKADLAVFDTEKDHVKFIQESDQLTADFGMLDAYDDMLRRSRLI